MLRRVSFALLFAALACSQAPGKTGPVVAQGNGITITADELKARLDEQSPMIRASFNAADRKKQFLDNMVRFELLAKAAEKEGLAKDPDVLFTMKKVMVSKYYQRFFQDKNAAKAVPDADVQKYYDEHKDEFHRDARVHAAHVFLKAEAGGADRAKKAAAAKKLLAKVLADEKAKPGAFAALARESSEDAASKGMGGDMGFKTRDELEKAYGKAVADAALALGDNQTSSSVIETPAGFHLLRVLGRQPEMNRTLEEAKPMIAARLNSQRKTKEFDEFVKKLRDQANVKIDDAALAKVEVAAPPAGSSPHGPMMGGGAAPIGPARPAMPVPAGPAPAAPPRPAAPASR